MTHASYNSYAENPPHPNTNKREAQWRVAVCVSRFSFC